LSWPDSKKKGFFESGAGLSSKGPKAERREPAFSGPLGRLFEAAPPFRELSGTLPRGQLRPCLKQGSSHEEKLWPKRALAQESPGPGPGLRKSSEPGEAGPGPEERLSFGSAPASEGEEKVRPRLALETPEDF
jgi:hypothetical protein